LEGEQERRGKTKKMTRIGGISPQAAETATSNAMTTSMVEEAGNATSVDNNRTHSNGGSRKDGCSDDMPSAKGKGYTKKPLCYEDGQEEE